MTEDRKDIEDETLVDEFKQLLKLNALQERMKALMKKGADDFISEFKHLKPEAIEKLDKSTVHEMLDRIDKKLRKELTIDDLIIIAESQQREIIELKNINKTLVRETKAEMLKLRETKAEVILNCETISHFNQMDEAAIVEHLNRYGSVRITLQRYRK